MRVAFAGTPEFAAKALQALHRRDHEVVLVLTQPDRPVGRGLKPSPSAVKAYALAHGLPLEQPATLKNEEGLRALRRAAPQALVVAAYGMILPQPLLDVAPLGALNIHASLLPRWRGAAPIQRAILAGDLETGISIMRMDAGLDTGPVLAQRAVPISSTDDAGTLHHKLAALGAQMIVHALDELAEGALAGRPQPQDGVTYAAKVTKDETVLRWDRPAVELERMVRAFRPVPGAATTLNGEILKIWDARVLDERASPGVVTHAGDLLVVGCGKGSLAITEMQRPGGRRMPASEFMRGNPVNIGTRLG